jgi:Nucleotidyltransferase domain
MNPLDDLLARASADPAVLGVVLTGSVARGMAASRSDVDVIVVVAARGGAWSGTRRSPAIDEIVMTVDELADTSDVWQRYAFRGARVLLDRLDGRIAELVAAQATPAPDEAARWAREGLDAYLNSIYRAAKSRRDGRPVEARLDEMESSFWLLGAVFALHGRLRPYNKYLRWELATYPLGSGPPWDAQTLPERVADAPASLFPEIEVLARARGFGDVIDAWGADLDVVRAPSERAGCA